MFLHMKLELYFLAGKCFFFIYSEGHLVWCRNMSFGQVSKNVIWWGVEI